jgi:hypothetical protein
MSSEDMFIFKGKTESQSRLAIIEAPTTNFKDNFDRFNYAPSILKRKQKEILYLSLRFLYSLSNKRELIKDEKKQDEEIYYCLDDGKHGSVFWTHREPGGKEQYKEAYYETDKPGIRT